MLNNPLQNIMAHSGADKIEISLVRQEAISEIIVSNNGIDIGNGFFHSGISVAMLCKSLIRILVVALCRYIAVLSSVAYFGCKQNLF
ncbi:MAG: hypothetical protein RSD91_06880 [Clostridiales bacterium]